jgi:hypothetical protein
MKRSEAINIIFERLFYLHEYSTESSAKRDAENILYDLEKAGMLPPTITNHRVYEEDCYNPMQSDTWNIIEVTDYYRAETPYKLQVNEWEKE